jgi:hypothetical protein
MIEVVVYPVEGSAGNWSLDFRGTKVVKSSKTPLLTFARLLLNDFPEAEGMELGMRHRGTDLIALQTTVGHAAKLTVVETAHGRPCFVKWRPFNREAAA